MTKTAGKFLYTNDGKRDYVISEGTSLVYMNYIYDLMSPMGKPSDEDSLSFSMQSSLGGDFNLLLIPANKLKVNLSFAVESLIDENRKSSESLKHLVTYSDGAIIIRELTGEEQKRLEKYKQKKHECK